jgi:hypothetical protein
MVVIISWLAEYLDAMLTLKLQASNLLRVIARQAVHNIGCLSWKFLKAENTIDPIF